MAKKKIFWCKNCLNMSTRPKIEFDERGFCNACQWVEEKKTSVDWDKRWADLEALCDKHRKNGEGFDCLVPVSGGKDGSYMAYMMREKLGMNPLTFTIRVPMAHNIGQENLMNFINKGYNHIHLTPNVEIMRTLDQKGFKEWGRPLAGWQVAVFVSMFRLAKDMNIPFIVFAENGDVEYGGSSRTKNDMYFDTEYAIETYMRENYHDLQPEGFSDQDLYFFKFPKDAQSKDFAVKAVHFSYFENWDPYEHYLVAKEHCGLKENNVSAVGTYVNFAQMDGAIYELHVYMMYLKFGFGRCTQDCGIDIRRGAMTREQAKQLVKIYDNCYPEPFIDTYLDYYQMTKEEFDAVLDKHANRALFEKVDGLWTPKFNVDDEIWVEE